MAAPGITRAASSWRAFKSDIERAMDAAPLMTAHPEDTLVLAGPPHIPEGNTIEGLSVLGMLQMFNVASASPTTPLLALGSNRQFYSKAKAQNSVTLAKLLFNRGNLLYKLYENVIAFLGGGGTGTDMDAGIQFLRDMDEPALAPESESLFMCDLDSPLFGLPFGLCVLFRTKIGVPIGGMYLERCTIQTWNLAFASGQNVVAENCAIIFDRPKPYDPENITGWEDEESRAGLQAYIDSESPDVRGDDIIGGLGTNFDHATSEPVS